MQALKVSAKPPLARPCRRELVMTTLLTGELTRHPRLRNRPHRQ